MTKCKKCGSEDWSVTEQVGSLETWRCGNCGEEIIVHVSLPNSAFVVPLNREPVYEVAGHWTSKPTQQMIADVMPMLPGLRDLSASALIRAWLGKTEIVLGRFGLSEIAALEANLGRSGMVISKRLIFAGDNEQEGTENRP